MRFGVKTACLGVFVALLWYWATYMFLTARQQQEKPSKPRLGSGQMFDGIADYYDAANRLMSLGQDRGWRKELVDALQLKEGDMVLDLATGTADVAILIGQKMKELGIDGKVIGVDPSSRMLQKGFFKISDAQLQNVVSLRLGDAQQLTISSAFFDKISISFGIRNVNDKLAALKEAHRVIKKHKDSRFCILEFSQPQRGALAPVARLFITHILPWVGSYVAPGHNEEYVHLKQSITDFPPPGEFANLILKAGFQSIEVRDIFFDIVHLYTAIPVDSKSPFTRFLPSVW